ncbi:low molecular weight protein-tyrosine-phosphatase [Schaalia suimastitidis]|uniref:low molecular weight protein-tyrosine-phosphatase n=1 Tax=Schaalia suimastitidis TaxID=121163 RepID=UPI0003FA9F0F|nr:low molecular weight protein-tyrosine-phosphatase [Schaalia suimastitidis]
MTLRVLMVCTGNICRSTMAHQVLEEYAHAQGLDIVVDSAGISDEERGNPIDRRAARVLRENGYGVPDHRARQVQMSEIGDWDLILAMTEYHLRSLHRLRDRAGYRNDQAGRQGPSGRQYQRSGGENGPQIRMFREFDPHSRGGDRDLPDPWYGGHQDFVDTLEVIERSMPALIEYLRDNIPRPQ